MVRPGFNSRLHFCFFFSITRLRIDLGWQYQLQLFDLPHECWNVGDSSAGPKMAAGSADQTWRLAVPGSAGQCQKKNLKKKKKSQKKFFFSKKKFFFQKTILFPKKVMDFKKTAVFAVFKGIKAFNIAITYVCHTFSYFRTTPPPRV